MSTLPPLLLFLEDVPVSEISWWSVSGQVENMLLGLDDTIQLQSEALWER